MDDGEKYITSGDPLLPMVIIILAVEIGKPERREKVGKGGENRENCSLYLGPNYPSRVIH